MIIFLASCGLTSKKINNCNFNNIQGDEFVLRQADKSIQSEMYPFFNVPDKGWETKLSYKKYTNLIGKVYKMPPMEEFPSWAEIDPKAYTPVILETCEVLYTPNHSTFKDNSFVDSYIENAYFLKDLDEAKMLVGKKVWKRHRGTIDSHKALLTNIDEKYYPLIPYDGLEVIGVDKTIYKKSVYTHAPFNLIVKDKLGNKGIVSYSSEAIFIINPIDDNWTDKTVQSIKNERVAIGMTPIQARLAWGLPSSINRTITANGSREQWIYKIGSYLYFDSGLISAIQN
jgi:hypothetical protein